MSLHTISILMLTTIVYASCSNKKWQRSNSRVAYFHYGGYSDTLYSTLEGEIFHLDTSVKTKDSLLPVQGAEITVLNYSKTYTSDSNGKFVINLKNGNFSLLVSKQGFQPLLINNYRSDPDQISGIKIYLEHGTEQQSFEIPKEGTKQ